MLRKHLSQGPTEHRALASTRGLKAALLLALAVALPGAGLVGCGRPTSEGGGASVSTVDPACGDPAAHVYHPARLQVLDPCRTVSGIITAIRPEADGDLHVLLQLDERYSSMLRPANLSGEHGDLVLEPVCQVPGTQADALAACASGASRLAIPPVGMHVVGTGAYVLDLDHGGWAELHPLFSIHPG